jgi:hypothetical protein
MRLIARAGSSTPSASSRAVRAVVLRPNDGRRFAQAGPVITCRINLGQHVHYSASGKDVSWHWTWSCDQAVTLTGTSSLYDEGYRIRTVAANGAGRSGTENVRYGTCVEAPWWGTAVYTFSAPGYTTGSGEGSSPTSTITCP